MPFKPLTNALLKSYKAPFEMQFYKYLIASNLRRYYWCLFLALFFAYFVTRFVNKIPMI